jgi:hypothetical protein
MSKFEDNSEVKLILKVVRSEKEKQEFIDKQFKSEFEVRANNNKIVSAADYRNNILYVFVKPSEGDKALAGFSSCHEILLDADIYNDMKFYSKLAEFISINNAKEEV